MLALLLGIEIVTLFLGIKSFGNKNNTLDDIKLLDNKSNNLFAIMIDDGNGNYTETNSFPTTGYKLNIEKSICTDNSGEKIDLTLEFNDGIVSLDTEKTIYCYLYFDKNSIEVYDKVIEDYNSSKGVEKTTDENGKEIYYYTGNITNNNLVLNNYCWKMVRTTETDGVKLIYNGVYKDDTKCNNTGNSTRIEENGTKFNTSYKSLAHVGYMYGKLYNFSEKYGSDFGTYYYGSDVTWSNSKYTLSNVQNGTISNMYSRLNTKHYTCMSTSTSCTTVYYIYDMHSANRFAFYISLTNGKKIATAIDEMLNYNTTNSNIKTVIDNWYSTNMTNVTDYLENAIYCNNRHISNLGGWNPSGGSVTVDLQFNDYSDSNLRLTCQDVEDQFTLKVSSGGTQGYGNNALDYPVGLLTAKEAKLAIGNSSTNYLNNGGYYWLLTPSYIHSNGPTWTNVRSVGNGSLSRSSVESGSGARPAISLKKTIKITGGSGEIEDPYTLSLN